MKKTIALPLLALLLAACDLAHAALAVDNVTSRDAPELASVRAKIKAKDFNGALAELTPMLQTHQHADVYNLMGFSLRKTGDRKQAYTFYRKALDFDPQHKGALEYLGRALCRDRTDRQGARERRAVEEALPRRLRGTGGSRKDHRRSSREDELTMIMPLAEPAAALLGRLLLSAIFLHEAFGKLTRIFDGGRLHAGLRRAGPIAAARDRR